MIVPSLPTLRDPTVQHLFAAAVQTVAERERLEQEHASQQAAARAADYTAIRSACTAQIPPVLQPYVSRLLTDSIRLPACANDIAQLEIHFPDLALPLRARCYLQARTARGAGQWSFMDYYLPGVSHVSGPTGARMAYSFEEQYAARAYDLQDALAYLLLLEAQYRTPVDATVSIEESNA